MQNVIFFNELYLKTLDGIHLKSNANLSFHISLVSSPPFHNALKGGTY